MVQQFGLECGFPAPAAGRQAKGKPTHVNIDPSSARRQPAAPHGSSRRQGQAANRGRRHPPHAPPYQKAHQTSGRSSSI